MYCLHLKMYSTVMDYGTFKKYVYKAGFDIKEFAALLGMNHRSISNYSGDEAVPERLALIALLMNELEYRNISVKDIVAKLDTLGRKQRKEHSGGFKGLQLKK